MQLVFAEVRCQEIAVERALRRERIFRDRINPLNIYDDIDLYKRFRFRRASIFYLTDLLQIDLQPKSNQTLIVSPILQLLCELRFYATGSFQIVVDDSTAALSQPTISRIIRRVSLSLAKRVNEYIKYPTNQHVLNESRVEFYESAEFPQVTGVIDCTHICIQKPHEHEYAYVDSSSNHSINVQAVCDNKGKFIDVVAKWPGSTHDARILRESKLGKKFMDGTFKGLLIGDSGYPCFRWLLTPYLNPTTASQHRYSISLRKTRVIIEQVFGRWKRRFHLLHGEIRMTPERTCTLVAACAVLHNLAIQLNDGDMDENPIENDENDNEDIVAENNFQFRDDFALQHF
ncbi:putative nuclease HARBI1 [Hydra vulgaris]|uniref:putative nuclease HARBI1 n=1 Tax=Hydra vulgaris TaxID=6087 RepID=UPI0001924922|nr:putative nuclease HARBI1 [Hydra vulgaris]